jgi:hypothetical protein
MFLARTHLDCFAEIRASLLGEDWALKPEHNLVGRNVSTREDTTASITDFLLIQAPLGCNQDFRHLR